ncbi:hypothetical protein VDG1235_4504 [Verrucomicrobiia bacterium DG1235]|nr:hypothetical protein VDG1235_4504 [Verrucomicrobiae bacterium DG1235]
MKLPVITFSILCLAPSFLGAEAFTLAFGSCAKESKQQPIWSSIRAEQPDVFAMLGDNIYGDTEDMSVLRRKYAKLGKVPGFASLRKETELVAIWDDHDYGENDAGKEYPKKHDSRKAFLEFFREPEDSPRWNQEGGIYTSYTWGETGKRAQLILLDTRWNRDPLLSVSKTEYALKRNPKDMGPYNPTADSSSVMIGEAQWKWLETQLRQPADIRFIASGIQILSEGTGWEAWSNFPHERQRLFDLIESTHANGTVLLSGDTHWAEFSKVKLPSGYPLWELTSSGLTEEWKQVSPNLHRIGHTTYKANYGLIKIDWNAPAPYLTLSIKNENGRIQIQNTILISDLQFNSPES